VALSWLASTVVDRTLASGRVLLGRGTTWSGAPSIASGPFSGTKFSD
jgi:hypothetical protein